MIPRKHHNAEEIVADAANALPFLRALADSYQDWIRIGLSLTALGDEGLSLFHTFSAYSAKYDAADTDKKWSSLLKAADSSSIKPLFSAAQRAGWRNPGFRAQGNSSSILTDRDFASKCAQVMYDEFAVIEPANSKAPPQFLKHEGNSYRVLNDIERRNETERVCKKVIESLSCDVSTKTTWLKKIGTIRGLNDVCEHIADVLILAHEGNKVRSFPYFPCSGGVLNLLLRDIVPQRYRPLPLCSSSVKYDPLASAPLFTRVVGEIFEHDQAVIRFIFQLFGLILLGRPEQYFFVWLGKTASNGKSLLLKVLQSILGPYYTGLPTAALMVKSHTSDGANPAIAQLAGKRLAVISEPTAKQSLDSSLIKQITGDGYVNVRDNYGAPRDMPIEAVLLMVANYMPAALDDDNGLWRRALVVPFNRTFTAEEDDKELPTKLQKEKAGILNIMIDGAHDYLAHGLLVPEKVKACVDAQRQEVDPFAAFFTDCLTEEKGTSTGLKEIYGQYLAWARENSRLRKMTKPEISKRLQAKYPKRLPGNLVVFDGVALTAC